MGRSTDNIGDTRQVVLRRARRILGVGVPIADVVQSLRMVFEYLFLF